MISWNKSEYHMTDKEICLYYCQKWDNVKHMKDFVLSLRKRYQNEIEWHRLQIKERTINNV
tara:strand:+ start:606 stop:788 length:183 start_codon:yes stop_codon:yes gene_type:complete